MSATIKGEGFSAMLIVFSVVTDHNTSEKGNGLEEIYIPIISHCIPIKVYNIEHRKSQDSSSLDWKKNLYDKKPAFNIILMVASP